MWYKVKELWGKGLNKSQIKEEPGIDRSTIHRYISMSEDQFLEWIQTSRHLPKKLKAYYSFVKDLLDNASYLSAAQVEDRLKESFSDLPKVNSKTVYNFVHSIRKEHNITKHKEKLPRQYEKLAETEYGEEAQVDFGSYRMLSKGSGIIKPAFRKTVLPVVAIALATIVATLFREKGEGVRGRSFRHVGIHVPNVSVGVLVGFIKSTPQGRVGEGSMVVYYLVPGLFQSCPG